MDFDPPQHQQGRLRYLNGFATSMACGDLDP